LNNLDALPRQSVVTTIERCAERLFSVGESPRSVKLSVFAEPAQDPLGAHEAEEVLSWFGGMGSFSDVLISEMSGHDAQQECEDRLSAQLNRLRSEIDADAMEAKLSFR
jgi:hypothetical protein